MTAGDSTPASEGHLEAVRKLELARGAAPTDPSPPYLLAQLHLSLGDWESAAACAGAVLELYAGTPSPQAVDALAWLLHALAQARPAEIPAAYHRWRAVQASALAAAQQDPAAASRFFAHAALAALRADDNEAAGAWLNLRYSGALGLPERTRISPTIALEDWCRRQRVSLAEPEPARRVSLRNGQVEYSYVTTPCRVAAIPGGEVVCGWDYIAAPTGEIISDSGHKALNIKHSLWLPHVAAEGVPKVLHLWPEQVETIDEDVLFLHGPERMHMGHWIADFLPRLRALRHAGLARIKIGLPEKASVKHRDMLAMCGVRPDDLLTLRFGARRRFRNVVAVQSGNCFEASPELGAFFGNAFRGTAPLPKPSRRIFLERSIGTRQIANKVEVADVLAHAGFETLDLTKLSVADQCRTLRDASIVICTYGSDPLAAFFMQSGSDMIEFKNYLPAQEWRGLKSGIDLHCTLAKINLHEVACPTVPPSQPRLIRDRDFIVDCAGLSALLSTILSRKAAGIDNHVPLDMRVETISS